MRAYIVNQSTKTIKSIHDDKILFFGLEDFMNDIVKGNCCFICGAQPGIKQFNDEHIIPDWILRKFDLYNRQITLPNGTFIKYGKYKVPCCLECNSELGKNIEVPISELLKKSYNEVVDEIKMDDTIYQTLFRWVCLIYLKTHLKDSTLLMERDRRKDAGKIGDYYDWSNMHHIHCKARLYYTGAIVQKEVYGTILVIPAFIHDKEEAFDYIDNLGANSVMIQMGEICIIAVLNDSQAGGSAFHHQFEKITGHLTPFQVREILTHMIYINANMKERPKHYSTLTTSGYEIKVDVPEKIELYKGEEERVKFGELLHDYVRRLMPDYVPNREEIFQGIKEGRYHYLFNEEGEFIQHQSKIIGDNAGKSN
jgi:hypothetical protein